MKDRNDEIRQANRKALPKFLLMMVCCGAVGGAIGFCLAFFGAEQLAGAVRLAGITFGIHAAPWLLLPIALYGASLILFSFGAPELPIFQPPV